MEIDFEKELLELKKGAHPDLDVRIVIGVRSEVCPITREPVEDTRVYTCRIQRGITNGVEGAALCLRRAFDIAKNSLPTL